MRVRFIINGLGKLYRNQHQINSHFHELLKSAQHITAIPAGPFQDVARNSQSISAEATSMPTIDGQSKNSRGTRAVTKAIATDVLVVWLPMGLALLRASSECKGWCKPTARGQSG
ncbi:hypothetical protein [Geofilum rubicundum]|uniref:hypothetical protein n=1 Tax=Geofilum rubicundum TaxID=472113 RepID=UPI0021CD9041|nr:hypothetical protein [Geofilum rubicundum]